MMSLVVVWGCSKGTESAVKGATMSQAAAPAAGTAQQAVREPTTPTVDPAKKYHGVIETSKGTIEVELYAKEAPLSVTNFVQLAQTHYYDGLTFHRVEPGFVIQGGDPRGDGTGGPDYTVKAEIGAKHVRGALAWARTGDNVNPQRRSSGSQFYITLAPTPFLDGQYTVFGKTVKGMDVVERIAVGDTIKQVSVMSE